MATAAAVLRALSGPQRRRRERSVVGAPASSNAVCSKRQSLAARKSKRLHERPLHKRRRIGPNARATGPNYPGARFRPIARLR